MEMVDTNPYSTYFIAMLRLAVDIGGTFTDVVAETAGGMESVKLLTSSKSPEIAALDAISLQLERLAKTHADIDSIVHGTTLATNALIERRGAKTAFITTAGFRDVLEMRYEKRFDQYALDLQMPEPLVARPLRFGLHERVLADGSIFKKPRDADIDALCDTLHAQQVEAVAIGFLHAYRNPANEQYVAQRVQSRLGNSVTVCQSAEVAGEIREYERFSTVVANAYVRPLMTQYLERLQSSLRGEGFRGSFLMMLSDGGLTTLDSATRFPIRLIEGGPAGGVALGAHVARETGSKKTLSLDIGGTTAKICFIENGKPQTTRLFEVARSWRDVKGSGLPVKVPTVELVEIGAGGGSIAHVDSLGRLKAGPRSSGSDPGPAAYNLGGKNATVTDAHLTLGNLTPDGFANGMIELSVEQASKAVQTDIQQPLEMTSAEQAAAGIIELADETMANAARVHGVELGLDVASFDLLVSGGGGGLHATRIADKLGIRRIIVPALAGVGSAVGFLRSPIAFESAITVMESITAIDFDSLDQRLQTTLNDVQGIVADALPAEVVEIQMVAELRYRGQGLEIRIPLPSGTALDQSIPALAETFESRYRKIYGFIMTDIDIELVSLSVSASESKVADTLAGTRANSSPLHATSTTRCQFDLNTRQKVHVPEYPRVSIGQDHIEGPLVIPESQTTTLVRAGWKVHASQHGHLIMEKGAK